MKPLSDKKYWDSIYQKIKTKKDAREVSFFTKIKNWIKKISRDYSNYVLLEMYLKFLPKSPDLKIIEIGCAPGNYLISFHKIFRYQPYGVEYSEAGYLITKDSFLKEGLNTKNITNADFFDSEFQKQNQRKYDLVFSRGFIEHFDNVSEVIDNHMGLLNDGGYLVVSIPNLRGLNYSILKQSNNDSVVGHNLSIMDKDVFYGLFKNKNLDYLYCDYIGTFSFGLFNTNRKWKYYLWRMLLIVQRPFDFLWRVSFGTKHIKNKYTSPYLLFIGKKINR